MPDELARYVRVGAWVRLVDSRRLAINRWGRASRHAGVRVHRHGHLALHILGWELCVAYWCGVP